MSKGYPFNYATCGLKNNKLSHMTYYYFFSIFNSILYLFCDNLSVFRDHQSFKNKTRILDLCHFPHLKAELSKPFAWNYGMCTEEHGIGPLDPKNSVFLILSSFFSWNKQFSAESLFQFVLGNRCACCPTIQGRNAILCVVWVEVAPTMHPMCP